jgi:hypothetical protein
VNRHQQIGDSWWFYVTFSVPGCLFIKKGRTRPERTTLIAQGGHQSTFLGVSFASTPIQHQEL